MKQLFDTVNWILMLAMIAFAIWAWPRLPEEIPTHFGLNGHPDAWSAKTLRSWFVLPAMGIGLTALMGAIRVFLPSRPQWVNLPDRRCLSELPKACQKQVLEMLGGFLAMVQTELLVIFSLIEWASYRSALGFDTQAIMVLVLILAVMTSPFLVIVFFLRFQSAMDKGMEAARRGEAGVAGGEAGVAGGEA